MEGGEGRESEAELRGWEEEAKPPAPGPSHITGGEGPPRSLVGFGVKAKGSWMQLPISDVWDKKF